MAINSEVIIWTCVTVAVLVGICAIVLIAMSSRNMKKNREAMRDVYKRQQQDQKRAAMGL